MRLTKAVTETVPATNADRTSTRMNVPAKQKRKKVQSGKNEESTPERILRVAGMLFSEHGYHGVSNRMIGRLANVNLATLQYHFGSKENLLASVYLHHLDQINVERDRLLAVCAADFADGKLTFRQLVDAYFGPTFRAASVPGSQLRQLIGRLSTDPSLEAKRVIQSGTDAQVSLFMRLTQGLFPEMTARHLSLRLTALWGAMLFVLTDNPRLQHLLETNWPDSDNAADDMFSEVRDFVVQGFQA